MTRTFQIDGMDGLYFTVKRIAPGRGWIVCENSTGKMMHSNPMTMQKYAIEETTALCNAYGLARISAELEK